MVYLGGGGPRRRRGLYLHDPPPGYRPPRLDMPFRARQRKARQEYVLMRVVTVAVIVLAAALAVFVSLIIAKYS